MVLAHNLMAQNAQRMFGINNNQIVQTMEKLSSGYRINRSADDAAGLAISEKMRCQIRGLNRASLNALDGISVIQTAEGAYGEMQDMLHRINELCTQAANDTNTDSDRRQIQQEIDQLVYEIDDGITQTTTFNTKKILMGVNHHDAQGNKDLDSPGKDGVLTFWDTRKSHMDRAGGTGGNMAAFDENGNISVDGIEVEAMVLASGLDLQGLSAGAPGYDRFLNTILNDVTTIDVQGTDAAGNAVDNLYMYVAGGTSKFFGQETPFSVSEVESFVSKNVSDKMKFFDNMESLIDAVRADYGDELKKFNYSVGPDGKYSVTMGAWADQNEPLKLKLQVGALSGQYIEISMEHLNARGLGINGLSVIDFEKAGQSMKRVQSAIDKVSTTRANLGAQQNRLEHTIKNLDNVAENTTAAESRIRDTNMAKMMVDYAKSQILLQVGQSMMASAQRSAQGALALLG